MPSTQDNTGGRRSAAPHPPGSGGGILPEGLIVREGGRGLVRTAPSIPGTLRPFEITLVRSSTEGAPAQAITSVRDVVDALGPYLAALGHVEEFWAVYLDGKCRVLGSRMVSRGSLTSSLVHPREVFAPGLVLACDAAVLAHNHPSGDPSPSVDDLRITERLVEASRLLGVRILDHVIIGAGEGHTPYVSMHERGLIPDQYQ